MRIALYGNGSSGNHGCEAIVRGTYTLIKEPLTILSEEMDEDIIYGLAKFCNVLDAKNGKISKARLIRAYMKLKLKNNYTDMDGLPYVDSIKKIKGKVDFALSAGGDNYCYENQAFYAFLNKEYQKKGIKTVLWGCSIEPEVIKKKKVLEDLKSYNLIVARESITYQSLKEIGANVILNPDPAFYMKSEKCILDKRFENGDVIGVNISPMIISNESLAKANVDDRMKIIELGESLDAPVRIDTYMYPSVRERNHAYNNQARLDPEMAAKARVEVLQREMGEEVFAQYRKIQLDEAENTPEGEAVPGQMACRAGKSSFVVNWQGEMRSCVVLDKPSIPLRDVEFEKAWELTKKGTESLRISARCSSCKLRKVCNTCVAAAIAETGKADGVPEYLCRYTEATVRYLKETSKK